MRPLRTQPTFTPPKKRSLKRFTNPLTLFVLIVVIFAVGWFYQARALPNVQLASMPVGNKTLVELEAIAGEQFKKLQFRFVGETRTVVASPAELGVSFDLKKTARQAYNLRRNLGEGVQLWKPLNTPLVITVDPNHVQQLLASHFGAEFVPPIDATIQYDASIDEFRTQEGEVGKGFSEAEITASIEQQAWRPGLVTFQSQQTIQPERTQVSIAENVDQANKIIRTNLNFLYQKKVMYTAEPQEVAAWLRFKLSATPGKLDIDYDRPAISAFLQQTVTESLNDFYGPVGSIPAQDATVQPAKSELKLLAVDDLINDIISALRKQTPLEKELEVSE